MHPPSPEASDAPRPAAHAAAGGLRVGAGGLQVSIGQHSDRGRKPVNQDFHGARVPQPPLLASKGVAVALADGIGSSEVSQVASEFAVRSVLDDYYCTSEAWPVRKSIECVLAATNSWLHAKTRQGPWRHDPDRGYVCTVSGLIVRSASVHLFHVGDARIWRLQAGTLELLTEDHRVRVSPQQTYLARAVGFEPQLDIDYRCLPAVRGDVFVLTTDGVHEHVDAAFMHDAIAGSDDLDVDAGGGDLDAAARAIVEEALRRGSPDNLTVQIVRLDALPDPDADEARRHLAELPAAPTLEAGMVLDGYRIVRELHVSSRSHVHLAVDEASGAQVAVKTPSVDLRHDASQLERFRMEAWIARRIRHPHVARGIEPASPRRHLFVVTEFVDGQTLAQWMADRPRPDLEVVRGIVEQVARGLQAFHRLRMLHQDLRPANVMIDRAGTVKLIDFGAARVEGIAESMPARDEPILGTEQYTAPECFLGEPATDRSDLFSLAVITYQMLSGRLPYGAAVSRARTRAAQARLRYESVLADDRELPSWIDDVLRKALHPDPRRRHEALSAFVHELRHPSADYPDRTRPPLIERHPVRFWQAVSAALLVVVLALAFAAFGVR